MAKKIVGYIKLQVPAGKANPSPPIGPALGQRGLNIMEFCKAFNAQTQKVEPGLPIPVVITAFADKSFTFIMKTPPATVLIKKAAKVDKGSQKPHTDKVGKLTRAQAEEIAKTESHMKVAHPTIVLSVDRRDGFGFGGGNFPEAPLQIAFGFTKGGDEAEARNFANGVVQRLSKFWVIHEVPSNRGAFPLKKCDFVARSV